jgi:hypothetical protein
LWYICVLATVVCIVQQIAAKQESIYLLTILAMAFLVENYKYALGMRGFFPKMGLQENRTAHGPYGTT